MKKILAPSILLACFLGFGFTSGAHAEYSTITLTDSTHRLLNGTFIDDALSDEISPSGSLGSPIYNVSQGHHIWVIDPALIEDVQAMANTSRVYQLVDKSKGIGQSLAQAWLARLKLDIGNDTVYAMAYGNPSQYWVHRVSPHIESYILAISQTKLASDLGLNVLQANSYQSNSDFFLTSYDVDALRTSSEEFEATSAYIDPQSIDTYRLGLIRTLNSHLSANERDSLIVDVSNYASAQINMVHLSQGRFTVTSTKQKLPITLTNNFPKRVAVRLYIATTNARVSAPKTIRENIPAHSKVQILLPVHVYSSGASSLAIRTTTLSGFDLGSPIDYPLQLSVLSPVATTITYGAAVLLFLAAAISSVRRIRSRRNIVKG